MNTTPYLSDESLMPFGKYRGKKMEDIPDDYLLWIYDNNKCDPSVKWYIERNLDAIKANIKQQENSKRSYNTYNSK